MALLALRVRSAAFLFAAALAGGLASAASAETRAEAIRAKLDDPRGGVFIVAHRGCHNPVPSRHMAAAPENSLAALEKCVTLGVDMMETDIRRSKDGALIIMHDATVNRMTDGVGRVADLTLAELKRLHLRQNFGGQMSPQITDQRVLTLEELLAAAKGRIMINLDIKEAIYPEVIAAAVKAGSAGEVLAKITAGKNDPALADLAPYRDAPFMPILNIVGDAETTGAVAARQASATHRIPAIELAFLDQPAFDAVAAAARQAHVRLWSNTLTQVGVLGLTSVGGDLDSLRDPETGWGALLRQGVTVFQTDEPAALMDYVHTHMLQSVKR